MVEYSADGRTAFYCGYKFRKDMNTGYFLCNKRTDAGTRERLHVFVYRTIHGDIPKGMHIHHVDGNKDNNEPSNLVMMTGAEHEKYHGSILSEERREMMRKTIKEKAIPKAIEWHKSEEGRKWHSKHAKEQAENLEKKEFVCKYCGKKFWKKPLGVIKFCSNNCKSAYRRKSKVDNIERECLNCGEKFETNKYSERKYCCRECWYEFRRNNTD